MKREQKAQHQKCRDVNCRIEGTYGEQHFFAFGFSVQELIVYNTNDKWEKSFIDRTEEAENNAPKDPTHKLVNLKDFSLYLYTDPEEAKAEFDFAKLSPEALKNSLILKPCMLFFCYLCGCDL